MYFDLSVFRNPLNLDFCNIDDRRLTLFFSKKYNGNFRKLIHLALKSLLSFSIIIAVLGVFELAAYGEDSSDKVKVKKIAKVNQWRFSLENQKLPREWSHLGFDDKTWRSGHGKFGYGDVGLETLLTDMRGKYSRIIARREFTVNRRAIKKFDLTVICDGPFIAYLNGIEVARSDKKWTEVIDISGFAHELHLGNNVLAIECANDDIDRSSFLFVPLLELEEE